MRRDSSGIDQPPAAQTATGSGRAGLERCSGDARTALRVTIRAGESRVVGTAMKGEHGSVQAAASRRPRDSRAGRAPSESSAATATRVDGAAAPQADHQVAALSSASCDAHAGPVRAGGFRPPRQRRALQSVSPQVAPRDARDARSNARAAMDFAAVRTSAHPSPREEQFGRGREFEVRGAHQPSFAWEQLGVLQAAARLGLMAANRVAPELSNGRGFLVPRGRLRRAVDSTRTKPGRVIVCWMTSNRAMPGSWS